MLFVSDILPTAYEVGVLKGGVEPGDTVAIVGAGPIGLAAIMTAKLHTPGRIIAIDLDDSRLAKALEFGADIVINNGREDALARVMGLTDGLGADVAIEAVGVPDTFELCTQLIRPGGRVANVGVHGKCVTLHLETLWIRDVMITAALVNANTTPKLLRLIEGGRLDPTPFATHHLPLAETEAAYDLFAAAAEHARAEGRPAGGSRRDTDARRRGRHHSPAEEHHTMTNTFKYGGFIAAAVLIVFGAVAIFMGFDGRSTVQSSLKLEAITGFGGDEPGHDRRRRPRKRACPPPSRCRRATSPTSRSRPGRTPAASRATSASTRSRPAVARPTRSCRGSRRRTVPAPVTRPLP